MRAHETCLATLRHACDQSGLDMKITEAEPAAEFAEFPTQRLRCPHGVQFWALPTDEEAAHLRAMNEVTP